MSQAPDQNGRSRADVSRLLYLDSAPARLILMLFVVANAVFTISTAEVLVRPWAANVAMVVVSATALLLVSPQPDPFSPRSTALILGAVAASCLLMAIALPAEGAMGRATWHLGSNTWLLFFLALRRRTGCAWLGMGVMMAITAAWGVQSGRGALIGLTMLDTHMGILLVGSLFGLILRRTAHRIDALNERSVASAVDAAATDAARHVRRARVTELADAAVPLLEDIAAEHTIDADRRVDFAIVEARLRDSVRGRSLTVPAIVDAAAAARRRGVEVVILDDRGYAPGDGEALSQMVGVTVERLHAAKGGRVTVRLLPAGRHAALTVVAADGDEVQRVSLDESGAATT